MTFKMKMEIDRVRAVITVYRGKDPRPVEFRGDAYWQWDMGREHNSAESLPYRGHNRERFVWAQALHDALEGWHASVLHTGEELVVLPKHPDYARVAELWDRAQAAA